MYTNVKKMQLSSGRNLILVCSLKGRPTHLKPIGLAGALMGLVDFMTGLGFYELMFI